MSVTQYVEAKDEYLEEHNYDQRISKLKQLTEPDVEFAEQLDRDWERASKTAGKKTRKVRRSWWSSKLAKARQAVPNIAQHVTTTARLLNPIKQTASNMPYN
jgi:hypothetical protein